MVSRILEDVHQSGLRLASLTVEQYHRMIATGILPEDPSIELLDGALVYKDRSAAGGTPMTVGPAHALVVKRLQRLSSRVEPFGCHLYCQAPVTLAETQEPEPDGVIARGCPEDYAHRHPSPADVLVTIEVSDSSLAADRTVKLRIYADSGVPRYVIVNIPDRQIELYEQPLVGQGRYAQVTVLRPGQTLSLPLGPESTLDVPVEQILP